MKYNMYNCMASYLAEALTSSDTSLKVPDGTAIDLWVPPALVLLARSRGLYDLQAGEIISLDSLSGDVYTITRGLDNTDPQEHAAGILILGNLFTLHLQALEEFIALAHGTALSAIIVTTINPTTDLQVSAQSSPNMTVKINAGWAFVNRRAVNLQAEYTTPSFVAPVSATRVDVVCIDELNQIVIQAGTEGAGVPTLDSDRLGLAQITFTPATTSITSGEITDVRIYY